MKFRIKAIYFFVMRKWNKNYLEKAQEFEEFVFQERKQHSILGLSTKGTMLMAQMRGADLKRDHFISNFLLDDISWESNDKLERFRFNCAEEWWQRSVDKYVHSDACIKVLWRFPADYIVFPRDPATF